MDELTVGKRTEEPEISLETIKPWKEALREIERNYLEQILRKTDWDISKTAELLEIHPSGLYKKIRDYDLEK